MKTMKRIVCGMMALVAATALAEQTAVPAFTADFSRVTGPLKRLNGLNNTVPIANTSNPENDLTEEFRELEIPYTRFHDAEIENPGYGLVDVSRIFPLFHADENDPRNYCFETTDDYLKGCLATGSEIEFRLGETIEHDNKRYRVRIPADIEKWSTICLNIARHYRDGWANGYHWNIRRWAIWEEPDNYPQLLTGPDYATTTTAYLEMYEKTAKKLKAAFPDVVVCGPQTWGSGSPFIKVFLDRCQKNGVPLGALAWNNYARTPEDMFNASVELRRDLDARGLKETELAISEWHYGPPNWDWTKLRSAKYFHECPEDMTGADSAVYMLSCFARMQDSPVDRMYFYSARTGAWGLWGKYKNRFHTWYAMKAFALLAHGRDRIDVPSRPAEGVYAVGTRDAAGVGRLLVLVKDARIGAVSVDVRGAGAPTSVKVLDYARRLEEISGWTYANGRLTLPVRSAGSIGWLVTLAPKE